MLISRPAQQNVAVAVQADGARDVGELGVHKTLVWLEQLTHDSWPAGGSENAATRLPMCCPLLLLKSRSGFYMLTGKSHI